MQRRRGTLGDDSDMTVKRTSPEARSIRSCESAIPVPGTVFHAIFLLFSLPRLPPPSSFSTCSSISSRLGSLARPRQVLSLLLLFSLVPSLTPSSPDQEPPPPPPPPPPPRSYKFSRSPCPFHYSCQALFCLLSVPSSSRDESFVTRGTAYARTCGYAYVRRSTGLLYFFQVETRQRIKTVLLREEKSSPSLAESETSGKLASHGLPRTELS